MYILALHYRIDKFNIGKYTIHQTIIPRENSNSREWQTDSKTYFTMTKKAYSRLPFSNCESISNIESRGVYKLTM